MKEPRSTRTYDVIVYGATGFTGKLVTRYLLARYGLHDDLHWAIAGRSAGKLQALKDDLGATASNLETLVADSADDAALRVLAKQTRVVLTTVGPYALYGSELVAACVEAGTDYCDLAGEVQWIRKMIDTHQERAAQTGARIVHCCGFDSVPMDIGVWFLAGATANSIRRYVQQYRPVCQSHKRNSERRHDGEHDEHHRGSAGRPLRCTN